MTSNATRYAVVSKRMKELGETELMKHLLSQAKNSDVYLGYLDEMIPQSDSSSVTKKPKALKKSKRSKDLKSDSAEPHFFRRLSGVRDINALDFSDLEDILREPILSRGFKQYMKKRRCDENMNFWKEANYVATLPSSELMSELECLYTRFIKPGSKEELNLNAASSRLITQNFNELKEKFNEEKARKLFKKAQDEVLALIHWDSFQKFIGSPEFVSAKELVLKVRGIPNETENLQITESDWQVITTGGKDVEYKQGGIIIEQGEAHPHLYILKEGEILAQKTNSEGKTIFLPAFNTVGGVFGEMSLLGNPAVSSVIANSKVVKVKQLKVSFLYRLFEAQPELGVRMYNFIGKRLSVIINETEMRSMKKEPKTKPTIEAPLPEKSKSSLILSQDEVTFQKNFKSTDKEKLIAAYDGSLIRSIVRRGTIYITEHHISFCGSIFGQKTKEIIPLCKGVEVSLFKELDFILIGKDGRKHKFRLQNSELRLQVVTLLQSLLSLATEETGGLSLLESQNQTKSHSPLSEEEWDLILNPKTESVIEYQRGDCIIQEGVAYKVLFQTVSGTCRVEKQVNDDGLQTILGTINAGEVLGEINFFTHKEASASVVVTTPNTEVYLIDKEYLWKELIQTNPGVVMRFYFHLCSIVSTRLAKYN